MKLPMDKKEAIEFITQCNEAVHTCFEQENISALKETFEIRNQLIRDFFERFSAQLGEDDLIFFKTIKLKDEKIHMAMKGLRGQFLKDVSTLKKNKLGILSYTNIAKK